MASVVVLKVSITSPIMVSNVLQDPWSLMTSQCVAKFIFACVLIFFLGYCSWSLYLKPTKELIDKGRKISVKFWLHGLFASKLCAIKMFKFPFSRFTRISCLVL